jgi:hypothetical protein
VVKRTGGVGVGGGGGGGKKEARSSLVCFHSSWQRRYCPLFVIVLSIADTYFDVCTVRRFNGIDSTHSADSSSSNSGAEYEDMPRFGFAYTLSMLLPMCANLVILGQFLYERCVKRDTYILPPPPFLLPLPTPFTLQLPIPIILPLPTPFALPLPTPFAHPLPTPFALPLPTPFALPV